MNKLQQARYNAYLLSIEHLEDNKDILSTIPIFETLMSSARATLAAAELIKQRKLQNKSGVAEDKKLETEQLASMAHRISSVIFVFASIHNNRELRNMMEHSLTELKESPDKLGGISNVILEKGREFLGELGIFGINIALLNNFAEMISAFEGVVLAPRDVKATRKYDNQRLKELMAEAHKIFSEHLDPMMVVFKQTHEEFYGIYKEKRVIVNPYTRHTRISGVIADKNGQPLDGLKIQVADTEYGGETDAEGKVEIKVPLVGKFLIVIKKEETQLTEMEKTFSRGKKVDISTTIG